MIQPLLMHWRRVVFLMVLCYFTGRPSSGFAHRLKPSRFLSRLFSLNFYAASEDDLSDFLTSMSEPKYREAQIRDWVYKRGIVDFDSMGNIPVALKQKLKEQYHLGSLSLNTELVSTDGTKKRAYRLKDGQLIESVLMPYRDGRWTACISSQAGCAMGCKFCATGQMGFFRQLSAAEIFEQAQLFSSELIANGQRLSNIVMMGMGEPLNNYENVMTAVRRFGSDLGIGARHVTISTVGIAPRIRKLAEEGLQVGLAISLHHTNDEKRSALMPVNDKYPIAELLDSIRYYSGVTNRRVTFEWALIQNQTDTEVVAHELGVLLKGLLCHVNVIPLNPTKGFGGVPTSKAGVAKFINILGQYGISATPRMKRGIDINAGCGQLTAELKKRELKKRVLLGGEEGGLEGGGTAGSVVDLIVPPVDPANQE